MFNKVCVVSAILAVLELLINFSGVSGLQCYNCRGITNYDPNGCFTPTEKTIVQECKKGEVCEKRVTMIDRLQDVIDRGCSANCDGRTFVWTDEYQVYCCDDGNKCNTASRLTAGFLAIISILVASLMTSLTVLVFI